MPAGINIDPCFRATPCNIRAGSARAPIYRGRVRSRAPRTDACVHACFALLWNGCACERAWRGGTIATRRVRARTPERQTAGVRARGGGVAHGTAAGVGAGTRGSRAAPGASPTGGRPGSGLSRGGPEAKKSAVRATRRSVDDAPGEGSAWDRMGRDRIGRVAGNRRRGGAAVWTPVCRQRAWSLGVLDG